MKLNRIMKILVAILLVAMIAVLVSQVAFAYDPTKADFKDYEKEDSSGAADAARNIIGFIINVAQIIGTGVAIIMLVVLAIQYIAASPEGKAEIKKNATIYIVGAVILFAASGILQIIRKFAVNSVGNQGVGAINNTSNT